LNNRHQRSHGANDVLRECAIDIHAHSHNVRADIHGPRVRPGAIGWSVDVVQGNLLSDQGAIVRISYCLDATSGLVAGHDRELLRTEAPLAQE
jgi:hypothetical protein